ncbi:MAG: GAF domain-containing protein [Bacteroidetes bacterium]|nr:GAF domain-containing protein [Bacteroidota bacterium]
MSVQNKLSLTLFDEVFENYKEGVLLLDEDLNIIRAYGHHFRIGQISFSSLDDIFPGAQKVIKSKIAESPEGIIRFFNEIKLNSGELINGRFRIVRLNSDRIIKYAVYIKNNTKASQFKNDIVVNTERTNAWVYNEAHTEIKCIGNFDLQENKFIEQAALPIIAMPNYFKHFATEKIIVANDAVNDEKTQELADIYLMPNKITSMMDIPIRVEGEIIGVLCFEHRDTPREWNILEQKFGFVIAQMISLAIEANSKHQIQRDLEHAVSEQRVLLQEVHHRVKNNLAIISSLINLQSDKSKDDYHRELFNECRNRLNSIATIHQMLYRSKSFAKVNFKDYLGEIVNSLYDSYGNGNKEIIITKDLEEVSLDLSKAVPLSLIVNEVITNSFKHAFNDRIRGAIHVQLKNLKDKKRELIIQDDGPGFKTLKGNELSLGMDIIMGLVEQIEGKSSFESKNGTIFKLIF